MISSHYSNDDMRHWTFSRTSGLPRGYFDNRMVSASGWFYLCAAMLALAIVVGVML